jgi:hypothetical protein
MIRKHVGNDNNKKTILRSSETKYIERLRNMYPYVISRQNAKNVFFLPISPGVASKIKGHITCMGLYNKPMTYDEMVASTTPHCQLQ